MKTLLKIFLVSCVYAGCIFSASASVQRDDQLAAETKGQKLHQIIALRGHFKKGLLEITPKACLDLLKYAGSYKEAFAAYDRGISLRGWSNNDETGELVKLVYYFLNLKSVKWFENKLPSKATVDILGDVIQHYEEFETLDVVDTSLSYSEIKELLSVLPNPSSLKTLNIPASILSPQAQSEIKKKYPNISEFIVGTDAKDPVPNNESPKQAFSPTDTGIKRSGVEITGQLNGGHYELLIDITRKLAKTIEEQTGVEIAFELGEKIKKGFALGRGNFGNFMIARNIDVEPKHVVGVKQVKEESNIKNSLKEGEIQAQFKHPNVMLLLDYINYKSKNAYDYEELEPALYQFMPLAGFGDGAFFQQKLAVMKNTSLEDKREKVFSYVAEGLLKGLAYMHSLNFYHLDFKNTNFVLMRDGTPMIIDFGCTQYCSNADKYDKGMGDTPYYSLQRLNFARFNNKIEHAEKAEFYSPAAADAWALGVTLIEMWENLYPFDKLNKDRIYQSWDKKYFATKLAMIASIQAPREGSVMDVIKRMLALEDKDRLRIYDALQHPVFKNDAYHRGSEEDRIKLFKDIKALQEIKEITTGVMAPSAPKYTLNDDTDSQKVIESSIQSEPEAVKETPVATDERWQENDDWLFQELPEAIKDTTLATGEIWQENDDWLFQELPEAIKDTTLATAAIKIEKVDEQKPPSLKPLYSLTVEEQKPVMENVTPQAIDPNNNNVETKTKAPTPGQSTRKLTQGDINEALNKVKAKTLSWVDFAAFISSDPTLTALDFSWNQIGEAGATALAPSLKGMTALTDLSLSDNQIGDIGATALAPSLKGMPALTYLNLSNNQIGEAGATALAPSLKGMTALTGLNLGGSSFSSNQIGDIGATALAPSLKGMTALTGLSLSDNQIGDIGATALAPSLKGMTALTYLNLGGNQIGDKGATALAPSLKGMTALTYLSLYVNQIRDIGATALAPSLKGMTALTELYLHSNQIRDEGATALAPSLKGMTALTTLVLDNNQIGDKGKKALEEVKRSRPTLNLEY